VDDIAGSPGCFEVKKFLQDIPDNKDKLERLKIEAINNPLYLKTLISPDADTTAVVVFAYHRPDDENYRRRLIAKTNKVIDHYRKEVDKFYLAGWTTTNLSLSQYMKRDISRFIPVTYGLITLMVLLIFRNLRLTLLAVANITVCMTSTMGLFALTGTTINNVTTIVAPLIMALALSDTVHIFSHMEKRVLKEFPDKRKALASVLKKVILPCFLTTLTTSIGFLSLAVSNIPPIREFAYMASAGMVFEFIYSFFLLPPLILFFDPDKVFRDYRIRGGLTAVLGGINNLIQTHYRKIAIVTVVLLIGASWFAGQIRVETNLHELFKRKSPVRTSIAFMENRLSGVGSIDISLKTREEDAFKEPSNLAIIDRIEQYMKSLKGVDTAISFVDFLKDMNESFHDEDRLYYKIPATREMVSQYLLLYDSDDIDDFINDTYDHARISARVSEHGSEGQKRIIDEIRGYLSRIEHPAMDIRVTGRTLDEVNTNGALFNGQIYSLSLAAGIISIIMFLVFRSITLGFLSLLPNLFPIILNFGLMGAFGIPLNTATALISSVALGIAVDDTIHFLSEYNKQRGQRISKSESLRKVIYSKGLAIIFSSIILCIGFGVLGLSSFVPTIYFGVLSAIIMITALIGDVIVLPSILLLKK